jgi:hypothetical protein
MLNGSALYKDQISNFTLTSMSMPDKKTVVYNGTATITMKEGPVNDVPINIRTLSDNAISIWVDPAKTMNHFGNTPLYGRYYYTRGSYKEVKGGKTRKLNKNSI